jgi:hypothetical protein
LNDSTGQNEEYVPEERFSESEKAIMEYVNKTEQNALGVINESTPEALYNYMCFIISHHTSTSLIEVKLLDFFDFMSYIYITQKFMEEKGSSSSPTPSHQTSPEKELLGG